MHGRLRLKPLKARGSVPKMQDEGFASELGGMMEVAMWLCTLLLVGLSSSLHLAPNYVVLVLDNEYSSNFQSRLKNYFFLYTYVQPIG